MCIRNWSRKNCEIKVQYFLQIHSNKSTMKALQWVPQNKVSFRGKKVSCNKRCSLKALAAVLTSWYFEEESNKYKENEKLNGWNTIISDDTQQDPSQSSSQNLIKKKIKNPKQMKEAVMERVKTPSIKGCKYSKLFASNYSLERSSRYWKKMPK